MTLVETKPITEDELLRLSADHPVEVVNGEIVSAMTAASYTHVYVIMNIYDILKPHVKSHDLGHVIIDGYHYILKADAEGLKDSRIPDLSFVRKGRMESNFDPHKPFRGSPDLAVEVVSISESEVTTLGKVRDYLAAGTEQVWVLYPLVEELHVYKRDDPKSIQVYSGDDILEADTLFHGLKMAVKQFFVIPIG